jgi:hypothetical protein
MKSLRIPLAALLAASAVLVTNASSHREAPITALDRAADITDWFAFVSYDDPSKVTMIMNVDPLLEPANGPNWFPFDDAILYEMKIDNDQDAVEDVVFQFRFDTAQSAPGVFTVYAGTPGGAVAPANSPAPVAPGTLIVPPQITAVESLGHAQRQKFTVTMINRGVRTEIVSPSRALVAVPANVGPRTMDYAALFRGGIYDLDQGIRVFAGTTDDPFWIDLGAAFDTFNLRGTATPGILNASEDAAPRNFAVDMVSGFSVNSIAIEVPIELLTRTRRPEGANSPAATIGTWATTSRQLTTLRRPPFPVLNIGPFRTVQRLGNPLINELIIGTGAKDRFSMDQPRNDGQFVNFFLDPSLARVVNALTNGSVAIPPPPRNDLLPLLTYRAPIAAPGTPSGPIADMLRLNTGIPPTPLANASRLGLLGGDAAGFPNGRRVFDDVTDIALRLVVGGVLASPFPGFNPDIGGRLGDGVNVNDVPYQTTFPYLGFASSGRDRRHIDAADVLPTTGPPREPVRIDISSSRNPSIFGEPVTFTVTVSGTGPGPTPTGRVTLQDTGQPVGTVDLDGAGQATFTRNNLSVGSHNIAATYQGDNNYGINTALLTQVVNAADTTTSLSSSANPSTVGQPVTFTATVGSNGATPSGIVTFSDGGTVIGSATLTAGQATLTVSSLTAGSHDITATYLGNVGINESTSGVLVQVVNPVVSPTTTSLTSSPDPSTFGQAVTFSATVSSQGGTPTQGGVTFLNGTTVIGTAALNTGGQAVLTINTLAVGNHAVTAQYSGSPLFTPSTGTDTHTVARANTSISLTSALNPSNVGQVVPFTFNVTSPGGPVSGGVNVFDGTTPLGTAPFTNGVGTFTRSFSPGTHTMFVVFPGNATFNGSTSNVVSQVVNPPGGTMPN